MKFMTLFPHRFFINRVDRADRCVAMLDNFAKLEMPCERFQAIIPKTAGLLPTVEKNGCNQSHKAIVQLAKDSNWPNVFIFEDDVAFADDWMTKADAAVTDLVAMGDWDLFVTYFYRPHVQRPIKRASKELVSIGGSLLSHAYGINASAYDRVIAASSGAFIQDVAMVMDKSLKWYGTAQDLCIQRKIYSDIQKQVVTWRNWTFNKFTMCVPPWTPQVGE